MAIHNKNEMKLLKGFAIDIDGNHVLISTLQQHIEDNELGKVDRAKSMYRWTARVISKPDLESLISDLYSDGKRLQNYSWPDDPTGNFLLIGNYIDCNAAAKWYENKLKHIVDWETGQKILNGWHKKTATKDEGYNPNAKYEIDGYTATNGDTVSLADKDALVAHANQTLLKINTLKSQQKKNAIA